MRLLPTSWWSAVFCALWLLASPTAHALTAEQALSLARGDSDERIATINALATTPDERGAALLSALGEERVRVQDDLVLIVRDDVASDAVTGAPIALGDSAEDVIVNNRIRSALATALAGMELVGGTPERQRAAALTLQRSSFNEPDADQLPVIERALAADLDDDARQTLELAQAAVLLASED
ncbi:MAG: urea transport system permease protein, partial [Hydrogenophaga sp.]